MNNRFSANISMLFTELPFLERFEAARLAGFEAIEIQFPYAFAADDVAHALREAKLRCVLINLPAGDWEGGERGIACHENRQEEFRQGVAKALEYANALACPQMNCLVGRPTGKLDAASENTVLDENLSFAADALHAQNLRLSIEPINHFDVPNFLFNTSEQVLEKINHLRKDNVFLQYDIYHAIRMHENWAEVLVQEQRHIAHIQIADVPGRHEPGTGNIDFAKLFSTLKQVGYAGWVGAEYLPATNTLEGLGWMSVLN